MKKKNFNIVRFYLNDQVQFAQEISRKDVTKYADFMESIAHNNAGGITMWFRIDIEPKEENL